MSHFHRMTHNRCVSMGRKGAQNAVVTQRDSAPQARAATPDDLFALARRKWLERERIDIGKLALELGIGRATAFRWIGSKEALLGEILWSFYEPTLKAVLAETPARGAERIATITAKAMRAILGSAPMRSWLEQDAEHSLRVVTAETGVVQVRTLEFVQAVIEREIEDGHLTPELDAQTLSLLVIRISTSFLYSDLTCGREPSVDAAYTAIRILVGAGSEALATASD